MELIEKRKIDTNQVRAMCIQNDYYSRGTNAEYSRMFQMCESDQEVLAIAADIFEHSDTDKLVSRYGGKKEALENICYCILNDCSYICVDIKGCEE